MNYEEILNSFESIGEEGDSALILERLEELQKELRRNSRVLKELTNLLKEVNEEGDNS
jgi:hypothetical protein